MPFEIRLPCCFVTLDVVAAMPLCVWWRLTLKLALAAGVSCTEVTGLCAVSCGSARPRSADKNAAASGLCAQLEEIRGSARRDVDSGSSRRVSITSVWPKICSAARKSDGPDSQPAEGIIKAVRRPVRLRFKKYISLLSFERICPACFNPLKHYQTRSDKEVWVH